MRPVSVAGLVEPVTAERELTPDVRIRPPPGTPPGQLSMWIGDRWVIIGDVVHHPIQFCHSDWTSRDDSIRSWRVQRGAGLLDAAAATDALVLGSHFASTPAGRVRKGAVGYRFVPEREGPRPTYSAPSGGVETGAGGTAEGGPDDSPELLVVGVAGGAALAAGAWCWLDAGRSNVVAERIRGHWARTKNPMQAGVKPGGGRESV